MLLLLWATGFDTGQLPSLLLLLPQHWVMLVVLEAVTLLHAGEQGALIQVLDQSNKVQLLGELPCRLPLLLYPASPPQQLPVLLLLVDPADTCVTRVSDVGSNTPAGFSTTAETQALMASVVMRLAARASPICI